MNLQQGGVIVSRPRAQVVAAVKPAGRVVPECDTTRSRVHSNAAVSVRLDSRGIATSFGFRLERLRHLAATDPHPHVIDRSGNRQSCGVRFGGGAASFRVGEPPGDALPCRRILAGHLPDNRGH